MLGSLYQAGFLFAVTILFTCLLDPFHAALTFLWHINDRNIRGI